MKDIITILVIMGLSLSALYAFMVIQIISDLKASQTTVEMNYSLYATDYWSKLRLTGTGIPYALPDNGEKLQ